jgi:RNA polymerase sigma-70 factor (ECF subfamily)
VASAGGSASGNSDLRIDLAQAISALGMEHREVIVLRELQGMSYDQIAAVLAVPKGTVESRLFRARKELQALLKEYLP